MNNIYLQNIGLRKIGLNTIKSIEFPVQFSGFNKTTHPHDSVGNWLWDDGGCILWDDNSVIAL